MQIIDDWIWLPRVGKARRFDRMVQRDYLLRTIPDSRRIKAEKAAEAIGKMKRSRLLKTNMKGKACMQ